MNITYDLSLCDAYDGETALFASIKAFSDIDHTISDLNIVLNIEKTALERLKEILKNLIIFLQSSPHLQELTCVSFEISIGDKAAESTYFIYSDFSEFVIQLLNCIQRPDLVRELDLDFDFPFCLDMNEDFLETRSEYLIETLEKFDQLEFFSLEGYCLYDVFDSLGLWIKHHNTLSTVSLGALNYGAGTSMAYIREILQNLKIQHLSIIHPFHNISTFYYQEESELLSQQMMQATAQEVLDELRTLVQIRNHPSLKTFNFNFEFGELPFDTTDFVRSYFQTFIVLQQALLESRSLEKIDLKFQDNISSYETDLSITQEDIQFIQTSLIQQFKKNYMLKTFSLECFAIEIDPQLYRPFLYRNRKIEKDGDKILRVGYQLTEPNSPTVSGFSKQKLIFLDELLLNQAIPALFVYYHSTPVQHYFSGNSSESIKLKHRRKILETMVAEFFLLIKKPLPPRCVHELYTWIAAELLSYLDVQDLLLINRYNGLFKRQYRLENNITSHIGSLTAAGC